MPLPALSPPARTVPGATSNAFLRAAQAMLQDKQVTRTRVARLVAIANRDFHLVPDASAQMRAPVTELLRQIDFALQSDAARCGDAAARILTVELNQLKQQANGTCRQLELEVKRATTAADAARVQSLNAMLDGGGTEPLPLTDLNAFDEDSLSGWLTAALSAGLGPEALRSFAEARFGYDRILESFNKPEGGLEPHRASGFVDLQTAQRELDAADGVLARSKGQLPPEVVQAFDQALESIEKTVRSSTRFCRGVLKKPSGWCWEVQHQLARSWLGPDLPTDEDATPPVAAIRAPVTVTPPAYVPQETAQQTKPLVDLLTPHEASEKVPEDLIAKLVANAQQRYQYHKALCTPSNGVLEAAIRRSAGYVPLNAAQQEVEAAWTAASQMEDPVAKAGIHRSLVEISGALEQAQRYWQMVRDDKACALIPWQRALAVSWLGEDAPVTKRTHSDPALPALKVETTVKLLSWPFVASDRAHRLRPHDAALDPSVDRLVRERELRAQPLNAFLKGMLESTHQ